MGISGRFRPGNACQRGRPARKVHLSGILWGGESGIIMLPLLKGASMAEGSSEQRTTRRFALKLPVTVKYPAGAGEHASETEDVSAHGVFFYMDSEVEEGSTIEFTLTLPAEVTLTEGIRVKCTGRVVRVDNEGDGSQVGIAAAIEQYDFLGD